MKKKKKSKKNRKGEFSNTRLYDLLLVIFRENSKKKLNYKHEFELQVFNLVKNDALVR